MRVDVPRLLQDRLYLLRDRDPGGSDVLLARPTTLCRIDDDGPFLDGPVTPRVAIVDLDDAGGLRPGSRFEPRKGRVDGRYELDPALLDPDVDPLALEDVHFVQQSVFATVYCTIALFEEHCGRRIPWAFGRKQLLVVPRAGRMENAFYERESGSLQFFEAAGRSSRTVLTALSADIVAHETAHALLDGIAPDLYSAADPESLALHEAVADIAALLVALGEEVIAWSIENISSTSLDLYTVLAHVAEEFGYDLRRRESLRTAHNDCRFGPGPGEPVDRSDPHTASQVLTGAVYHVFQRITHDLLGRVRGRHGDLMGGEERRVRIASTNLAQLLLPALDLLPPGEASFADLGRAALAWSRLRGGASRKPARELAEELARRGVVDDADSLEPTGGAWESVRGRASDDGSALAEAHRAELGAPRRSKLVTRLVERSPVRKGAPPLQILRVGWDTTETHDPGRDLAGRWSVRTGGTLVLDATTGKALAWVTPVDRGAATARRSDRLRRWAADGRLSVGAGTRGIGVRRPRGTFRLDGTARSLHVSP